MKFILKLEVTTSDHDGPSFKFAYQIANLLKPNTFEAKDIRNDLEITTMQLSKEVNSLNMAKVGYNCLINNSSAFVCLMLHH